MTTRIHVFPSPRSPYRSAREPRFSANTGWYTHRGALIYWRHSVAHAAPECAYCNDGRCEQRVEWSPTWREEVVVHERVLGNA